MKCPKCKENTFGIIKGLKKNLYDYRRKERALFGCSNCNFKEVI